MICMSTTLGGQVLADNHFFPTNFTDVALPEPKITVGDYNQTADKMSLNVCNFYTGSNMWTLARCWPMTL